MRSDTFTLKRLARFCTEHRDRTAQLPTLKDLKSAGFKKSIVNQAVKDKILVELYVTLTTGAVVKGYKPK